MTAEDLAVVVRSLTPIIREFVDAQTKDLIATNAELSERISELEQRPAVPGPPGKDAPVVDVETIATKAAALVTPREVVPMVDPAIFADLVDQSVKSAVAALPTPKDGRSVTVEDLAPMVAAEVTKAVGALPLPKDGVGIVEPLIDRHGHLVLTLSDGQTKDVGPIVGRDVDMVQVKSWILEEVAKIPRPRDGVDGVGFDDLTFDYDEHGRLIHKYVKGDVVKTTLVPCIVDRGVYRHGTQYIKGDGVTWDGGFWIAHDDTTARPGDGKTTWRLAVKRGDKGTPGQNGINGTPGRDGRDFRTVGVDS